MDMAGIPVVPLAVPCQHQWGCSPSLCPQLASELKDTISCPLQSAKSTIGSSVDKIKELAAEGYEATKSTVETTAKYTRKNSVTQMAAAGVDTALGGLEKLMEYLLPEEDEEAGSADAQIPLRESGDNWLGGSSVVGCVGQEGAPGFWHKAA